MKCVLDKLVNKNNNKDTDRIKEIKKMIESKKFNSKIKK